MAEFELDHTVEELNLLGAFLEYFEAKRDGKFRDTWPEWLEYLANLRTCVKCDTNHVENCACCFGFGFDGDGVMLSATRAMTYRGTFARFVACPMCAGTPWGNERG